MSSRPLDPYHVYPKNRNKSRGKKSAFMIFVDTVGRAKFRREYGNPANIQNEIHKAILGGYWQRLSSEEREKYRKMSSAQAIQSKAELTSQATARLNGNQNATVLAEDPGSQRTIIDPNFLLDRDFKAKRLADRHKLSGDLRFNLTRGNKDIVLDQEYCFVGATPSCSLLIDTNNKYDLITVPFELTVIRFTLRKGIVSRHTYHMNIDPVIVLKDFARLGEISKQREKSVAAARRFGFEPVYSQETAMEEAWYFMKENSRNAKVVCDTDNYNFIAMSLRLLANSVNHIEAGYAQRHFGANIYCCEDVALALKDVSGRIIEDSVVQALFQRSMSAIDAFCTIHGRMPIENQRRHFCQEARGALNIQRLIDFLRSEGLHDMETVFDPTTHILCQELVEGSSIPGMPKHPLMSSDDVETERLDRMTLSDDVSEDVAPVGITRTRIVERLGQQGTTALGRSFNMGFDIPGHSTAPSWAVSDAPVGPEDPPPTQLGSTARDPSTATKETEPFRFNWVTMDEETLNARRPFFGTSPADV